MTIPVWVVSALIGGLVGGATGGLVYIVVNYLLERWWNR